MNLTLAGFLALVAPIRQRGHLRRHSSYLLAGGMVLAETGPMPLPHWGQRNLGKVIIP